MKMLNRIIKTLVLVASTSVHATESVPVEFDNSIYLNGGEVGVRWALSREYMMSAGFAGRHIGYDNNFETRTATLVFGLRRYSMVDEKFRYYFEGVLSPSHMDDGKRETGNANSLTVSAYLGVEYFLVSRISIEAKFGLSGTYLDSKNSIQHTQSGRIETRAQTMIVNWYF